MTNKRYLEFDPKHWRDPAGDHEDLPAGTAEISALLYEFAEDIMRRKGGVQVMTFLGMPGRLVIITPEEITEQSKQRLANLTRLATTGYDVKFTAMLSEVWMATGPDADKVMPSKNPDRQEGILLSLEWLGGKKLVQMCPIERGIKGKFLRLGALKAMHTGEHGGRFAGMLPPKAVSSDLRQVSRDLMECVDPQLHAELTEAEKIAKTFN